MNEKCLYLTLVLIINELAYLGDAAHITTTVFKIRLVTEQLKQLFSLLV